MKNEVFCSASGACTWPVEFRDSQWYDSGRGVLTFATTTMHGWGFDPGSGTVVNAWECLSNTSFATDGALILKYVRPYVACDFSNICLVIQLYVI